MRFNQINAVVSVEEANQIVEGNRGDRIGEILDLDDNGEDVPMRSNGREPKKALFKQIDPTFEEYEQEFGGNTPHTLC